MTKIPGVKLYSLQKGNSEAQLENLPDNIDITNLGKSFKDFSDTAAAIENLDLIIAVDSSVAHLSAAMGKDTFILLRYSADWKWLLNRDDTIWYEKVKLFRQNEPNDWCEVINRVIEHIKNEYNLKYLY